MSAPARTQTEDPGIKSPLLYQLSYGGVPAMLRHAGLPDRFWRKVDPQPDGCWLWTGALNSRGYSCFAVDGVSHLGHRVAYEALVGSIPEGYTIDHLCRVKRCVNPTHLDPVTLRENIRRAYQQNRPTHCPKGHEYTDGNTRVKQRSNGQINRTCRGCEDAAKPARNARARHLYATRHA